MNAIRAAVGTLLIYVPLAGSLTWADTPPASPDFDHQCGGESCAAVFRGLLGFFDRQPHGLDGNGRSCADCHMATDNFQLSPADAEGRFQRLQQRRERNPRADDPLFRPVDADDFRTNGAAAADFSNLRENGLIRITFTLPPNMKLIDPATNAPSTETTVDVWRMVPSVLNVKLTGPDGLNPWPRDPNRSGGYQLDARFTTLQDQALGAFLAHAEIQNPPEQRLLDDLTAFQRVLFTNERVRALSDAVSAGSAALARPRPGAQSAGTTGQSGVHTLMCAMPRRSRAIDIAGTGGSLSRDLRAMPAARRHPACKRHLPRALQLRSVPATACPQRAYLRNHEAGRLDDAAHQLGSRPRSVDGICGHTRRTGG